MANRRERRRNLIKSPTVKPVIEPPSTPPTYVYREIQQSDGLDTWGSPLYQSVGYVRAVLGEHAMGRFLTSSQLVDLMLKDDRISGVWDTRMNGLLGAPVEFEGTGDGRRQGSVIDDLRDGWPKIFPNYAATQLLGWGRWLGFGLGELIWNRPERGLWTPHLKVHHPRYLRWDWGLRTFLYTTEEGDVEVTPGDGKWVLFSPWGRYRGWMSGAIRKLSMLWLMRTWTLRDWARYSEVHGMPIRKAVVPKDASKEEKDEFLRQLSRIGSEATVKTPQGPEGEKFDLELVEPQGKSHEGFNAHLDRLDKSIAIAVLGQNLTTEVNGGSYAAASVHDRIRIDFLKSDAEALAHCVHEQILRPWAAINFGDADLAPELCWNVKTTEDKTQASQVVMNLGQGVTALQQAGMNIDLERLAEKFDIPLDPVQPVVKPDPTLQAQAKDAEAQAQADNPPSQVAADSAKAAADAKKQAANKPAPAPMKNSATDEQVSGAMVEGQTYVDAVGDSLGEHLRKGMNPDTLKLLDAVEAASDYESLRAKLVELYQERNPRKLARLIEKARLLADLTGRAVVNADTDPEG